MKKTDWTDRMLAALVELYPVETTAYTAAVLNLSESTLIRVMPRAFPISEKEHSWKWFLI